MAQGYLRSGIAERTATFYLFFRRAPFGGDYAVAGGIDDAVDWIVESGLGPEERRYLAEVPNPAGGRLFDAALLERLGHLGDHLHVDAVEEGELVFAQEPLLRVTGPLIAAQVVETALLTLVNFQTLIATKAARIRAAAGDDQVLEFGLRRAQGIDGALSASRAAYLGGVDATSNVLAGQQFGIPVAGTHAHSWVMAFDTETEAFDAYARAMPDNCVLLVDTYDTEAGVRRAVEVGRRLQAKGHRFLGVRLDSGDLVALSKMARAALDEAGLHDATVVASNDLDEARIRELKADGAQIGTWGIGTRLATGHPQAALGGVYKLSAIAAADGAMQPRIKLSEDRIKTSLPGELTAHRFVNDGAIVADVIHDVKCAIREGSELRHPSGEAAPSLAGFGEVRELLSPAVRNGKRARARTPLHEARQRALDARGLAFSAPVRIDAATHEAQEACIAAAQTSVAAQDRDAAVQEDEAGARKRVGP